MWEPPVYAMYQQGSSGETQKPQVSTSRANPPQPDAGALLRSKAAVAGPPRLSGAQKRLVAAIKGSGLCLGLSGGEHLDQKVKRWEFFTDYCRDPSRESQGSAGPYLRYLTIPLKDLQKEHSATKLLRSWRPCRALRHPVRPEAQDLGCGVWGLFGGQVMLNVRSRVACQASEFVGVPGSKGLASACLAYTSGTMTQSSGFQVYGPKVRHNTVSGAWFSPAASGKRL